MEILAVFAHPDDETMLAGGTMSLLAKTGANVHYLCATRGEGGEMGEPPVCTRSELGRVRQQEMECAVSVLGGASLAFLDYIDPMVGTDGRLYPFTNDTDTLVKDLVEWIRRLNPSAVFTHGSNGEYGHPAHILTHQAVLNAVLKTHPSPPNLYSISANFENHPKPRIANQDQTAHLILDLTGSMEIKVQAALCHRSQHALFVRRASKQAGRTLSIPEVLIDKEGIHRAWPKFTPGERDPVFDMLAPLTVGQTVKKYKAGFQDDKIRY